MKTQYKSFNFRVDSLIKIEIANRIIYSYHEQGLKLTLRQLYYQFVTQNIIPNQEKSYNSLGNLISDARLAGLINQIKKEKFNSRYLNVNELLRQQRQ